jgi:phosphoribosylformylglycinamidine cyclo-ligase
LSRSNKTSYASSGVSIKRGDQLVDIIKPLAKATFRKEIIGSIGGFAAASSLPKKYKNPILISCTDGVGTKIEIADALKIYDSIGIDLVAMCVNDLITLQAEPLFFLDYLVTDKINLKVSKEIIKGIAKGCKNSNCSLIGGETAEHPNAFPKGKFDLAGFCVGVLEKDSKKLSNKAKKDDVLIGLKSNGLHSNGFSLIRKLIEKKKLKLNQKFKGSSLGKALLKPTKIYVNEILSLRNKMKINALSHITGGGLTGNLERIIPNNLSAFISLGPKYSFNDDLFSLIESNSNLNRAEMLSTFNCGIGMILSIKKNDLVQCKNLLKKLKMPHIELGFIGSGKSNKKIIFE